MNQRKEPSLENRGMRNIEFEGITFQNTTYTKAGLADIIDFLKELSNKTPDFINKDSKVFHLNLSDFLQEFESEEVLKRYKEFYTQIEGNSALQTPFLRGEFIFNEKYYLLLGTKYSFSDRYTTDEISFQGIVFTCKNLEDTLRKGVDTSGEVRKILG